MGFKCIQQDFSRQFSIFCRIEPQENLIFDGNFRDQVFKRTLVSVMAVGNDDKNRK
jgi:hypothetical protein